MKECAHCKTHFEGRQESQRYCSKTCKNKATYLAIKASGRNVSKTNPTTPRSPIITGAGDPLLGFFQNQNQLLGTENQRLKAEMESLRAAHNTLQIEKGVWEQKTMLEKTRADIEKREGLSGFMETSAGERLLGMAETLILKKFGAEEETPDFFQGVEDEVAEGLKTLCAQLKEQSPEFIGEVMAIVQLWKKYPQLLKDAIKNLDAIKLQLKAQA